MSEEQEQAAIVEEKTKNEDRPLPDPPEGVDDPDQLVAAEERWTVCPLRDCKRDVDLLYQDFYLRDIRTDRVMCSACAVRTEIGYLAREVVKASDDRFFQGTIQDYLIVFGAMAGASFGLNLVLTFIPNFGFFLWFIAAAVGGAVGTALAQQVQRLTGRRVGRRSAEVAIAGLVTGMLLMPLGSFIANFGLVGLQLIGLLFSDPIIYLARIGLTGLIFTGAMGVAVWSVFKRRI